VIDPGEPDMVPHELAVLRKAHGERVDAIHRVRLADGLLIDRNGSGIRTLARYLFPHVSDDSRRVRLFWALHSGAVLL
jgi:hypothetical protein